MFILITKCTCLCLRRKLKKQRGRDHSDDDRRFRRAAKLDNPGLANENPASYHNVTSIDVVSGDVISVQQRHNAREANKRTRDQVNRSFGNTMEQTGGVSVISANHDVSQSAYSNAMTRYEPMDAVYENINDMSISGINVYQQDLTDHVTQRGHVIHVDGGYEKPSNYVNMIDRPTVYEQLDI